jgi:hypothetical protein
LGTTRFDLAVGLRDPGDKENQHFRTSEPSFGCETSCAEDIAANATRPNASQEAFLLDILSCPFISGVV